MMEAGWKPIKSILTQQIEETVTFLSWPTENFTYGKCWVELVASPLSPPTQILNFLNTE